jgi:tRNA modification GTPase
MTSSHIVPNMRHREALEGAARFFRDAAESVREEKPMEIAAFELKSGLDALGEVTGETAGEDVLDSIFSRFCLGK